MAVTFTKEASTADTLHGARVTGHQRVAGLLNLGTYATNGVAVAASDFISGSTGTIDHLQVEDSISGPYFYKWDKGNGKVEAYTAVGSTVTEVSDSTDISAATENFRVIAFIS